jgi:hypothetical protein
MIPGPHHISVESRGTEMGRGTRECSPRSPIGRGVVCLLPARPLGKPTQPTPPPPARVRGRSGEAGEGKPLPFLGTQELTEAAPPNPPPLPEVGTPSAEPPRRRAGPGCTVLSSSGDALADMVRMSDRPSWVRVRRAPARVCLPAVSVGRPNTPESRPTSRPGWCRGADVRRARRAGGGLPA